MNDWTTEDKAFCKQTCIMTSVEKRRSGRKSGGHRKHSDGGYSDTSSVGSFLDETDREVSNLTDRAFRSLCIGDEAVYNDSDLCPSSPCTQRDRQLAFSQAGQDTDKEDREREELKRAAHETFSLRVQQYGQDWIHGGMYGPEIHRDPLWEVYGERTQGRVSATFQHSFVETSQQENSLREEQLSFLSNGATELSSQQRRSRSRVSSLIRAFNSEGHRDGAVLDGNLREWNDERSWDKSALMSIQRELSEFSTSYQQNYNSGHFPSAGSLSSRDTNFYSSEVAAMAHMNSASSFMRSSHHSMTAQVNCNSNFFIHSEFSPFKVWRDHNRFPFQQGEVSGFMHYSEFPKWYETPMYKELSLEAQPQDPYRFEDRGMKHLSNNLAPVVPSTPPRSTSTSTMLQKASAVEKRCESELAGHYPHRKRTQSLGANRFPSQRPSTASPTIEMSRRVQDTISSVKALQQKIKMMTEQNITTGMTANQQGVFCSNDNLIPVGNNATTVVPNVISSNSSTTPFNISQLLTPLVHAHQEAETSEVQQYTVSPQPVEHPPVRAESRGATPDIRMSSYKSRATSLLFNLKDNRKRVKSTYSPTKFKGLETMEKNKQASIQEPRDTVIDIPDFPDPDTPHVEESSWTNAASHQYVNQNHTHGLSLATLHSQPATAYTGQYSEYTSSDYQRAQMQGEMGHHSGFTGFIPGNYASNQLANGQNLHEDLSSFTPYKQSMIDNVETVGRDVYWLKSSYAATEMPRLNTDNNQPSEYLINKANPEQQFNETVGREFTKADRYQQLKDNKHDHSNISSQDRWRQTNSQDPENLVLKAETSLWKQEITTLMEKGQHAQAYPGVAMITEGLNLPRDKTRGENQQSINKELEKTELKESFGVGTSHENTALINSNISNQLPQYATFSKDTVDNPSYYGLQPPVASKDKHAPHKYYGHSEENETKGNYLSQNYNRHTDQDYRNQQSFYSNKDKNMLIQETGQRKQYTPVPKGHDMQSLQPIDANQQFEDNMLKKLSSQPNNASAPTMANRLRDRQFVEVKAEQATAEHLKAQHAQAELAKAEHWAQLEQLKVESTRLILAGQAGSEKVKAEQAKAENETVNQAKAEHSKTKERKEERTKQFIEEQTEQAREKHTKTEQTRVQKVPEEPRNISEEAGAVQGEQVKAEQAVAERLKEEHIKTELATEQAGQATIQQAKTEQTKNEKIKAVQLEEDQVKAEEAEREQTEEEKIRAEMVQTEQDEAQRIKAEQVKLQQINEQQQKAEPEKTKVEEKDSIQPPAQKSKNREEESEDREAEQATLEQTKVEVPKPELTKTEDMQKRSVNPVVKLTGHVKTQQVKSETDKVEQVKTELAKAKAELAKIKEKMRGEQKEKVKNTVLIKGDEIKKDVPRRVNTNKNEECKDQDQATQLHQQREDLVVVSKQNRPTDQADRGADDYKHLREKYGFTETTNTNTLSTAGNGKSSSDANDTPTTSFDKIGTIGHEKSKDKQSPTSIFETTRTETKEEADILNSNELTESDYVYSESSKEFKLSGAKYLPVNIDKKANSDSITDKVKDDSVERLEKCDTLKPTDVLQQGDSDLVKSLPLEQKPKSSEHCVSKDPHFTPARVLSHKERAQTKQEILTSKIKAHAEKEISAIKEKGFAIRDGFISKTSNKQLAGSQSINIRQRPPSQDASKKLESTVSSNITPKYQMEHSGIQMEPVKAVSPRSPATLSVKSDAATSQLVDHSQKQVPNEPMRNYGNVPKPPKDAKQMGSYTNSPEQGLVENQKRENLSGIKSLVQSQELAPKDQQRKLEGTHQENSETDKIKEGLKDSTAVETGHLNKKNENPSQATPLVEPKTPKPMTTEKAESISHGDSVPSLRLAFGQDDTTDADDNLHITGIMVTVRERKPSIKNAQTKNSTQEQINVNETNINLPGSGLEANKGNKSLEEDSRVKPNERAVYTENENQTKVGIKIQSENVQETSTLEMRQNNVSENINEKKVNLQQESPYTNPRPQMKPLLQQPLAAMDVASTVTIPAKNKMSAETHPFLYNQDIIAAETKDYTNKIPKENSANTTRRDGEKSDIEDKEKGQIACTNESLMAKVINTGHNYTNDPTKTDAENLITLDAQPLVKENMTKVINRKSKIRDIDDKSAPLLEEKRPDPTPPKSFDKTNSSSNHSIENESRNVSPELQSKERHAGENNQMDNNVHIGSIAIRVVPAATEKDNLTGRHHVTTVLSDLVTANEQQQVPSSSHEENLNTFDNKDRSKDLTPPSSEKQMKDCLDDSLGVQNNTIQIPSSSMKVSNQQNSIKATSDNTQAEHGKTAKINKSGKSVHESKIQPMEGDYFQVQGVAETTNEPNNSADVGDTPDAVSKGRELPGSLPNKAEMKHNEGKNEVSVLDQSKRKKVESSSVSVQDENMKKKSWGTEDNLASNQSAGPSERQSESTVVGQAVHVRKHHTENQSSVSARQRQSSRNSHPVRQNLAKEKPEVKPKPKERVSTIPEISAIADYARLKVIVSEDQENTIQEFPPNKKEGFFPLIQTHHSRRPVFTADPQDLSVKEKSFPNKTEVSSNVNKEPKPLAFPITEKEHQRTGMFKLGDKERQEKMLLDAKANEDILDTGGKHIQYVDESNKLPTTQIKSQRSEEQVSGTDTQRVHQADQSIPQPNNPQQSQEITSRDPSVLQHLKPVGNTKMDYMEQSKQAILRRDKMTNNTLTEIGEDGTEKLRQERLATQHKETKAQQQSRIKHLEEEQVSMINMEKKTEDIKIKLIEKSRASLAEEERRAAQREGERRAREREAITIKIKEKREKQREVERRAEEERKAKQKEEMIKAKEERRMIEIEENRRIKIGEERKVTQKEEERATQEEQQNRAAQEEQQRAAREELQRRAVQEEQQKRVAKEEQQRRAEQEEQQRRAAQEEQQRRAVQEEQQKRVAKEEQQRRAAQEELQRRAVQEEQQKRVAKEEQQRRAAQEEQQRVAREEQQKRAAQEEQQKRAAQVEQQRRAAQGEQQRVAREEQQRRAAQEEQQKRTTQEEQQRAKQAEQLRRTAQVEQQRRAAQEEQQKRAAQEEQQRRAAQEEQQRRAAQEKLQRRAAQEEQQRVAQEEQQRRAAQEEQQRAAQEEQQKRAAQEEQQRRAAQEEQQKRASQEKLQRRAAQEEQQRVAQEEQQRRAAQEEQQRGAAEEEQKRRAALRAKQFEKKLSDIEEEKKRKQREEDRIKQIQEQKTAQQQIEEQRGERQKRENWMGIQTKEEMRGEKEKTIIEQREEKQAKEELIRRFEESQAVLKEEEKTVAQDQMLAQRDDEIKAKKREEEVKLAVYRKKERAAQMEEQKRAAQQIDALQYYSITSTELEKKPGERQLYSPLPSQRRSNASGLESNEDLGSHGRHYRPHPPASPAPPLPRSNTSSPALGIKPLMFRVKDNTFRGSSFTKSVKPRFHKNFGEDFRVGSPMGSERGEEEQEMRRGAGTPVYPDTGFNRLAAIKGSLTVQPASSSQDYSAPLSHHRPYSRRSIALDEDDSRSVISNMSEDVESFATSAADLGDIRGLYDYERPESACSFSSDVSRLGKPPAVPPKSEKALRRAKRLTTRRIKKELSKVAEDSPAGAEEPLHTVSNASSSSSTEVRPSNRHAVASPHFSPPVSLTYAPALGSSLPSSHTEHQSSCSTFSASPHATGPISLPVASPHATAPVSLPVVSPHATGPASHSAAPKTVTHVPSSPTLHHANHPAPVTQYHVESSYPQSYPLTQRKVLQDLGSGQYFVVDVPIQVKTKTFFDPETGKYVQLNVRESAKRTSQPQPQQAYLQPQHQPKMQVKPQQALSQASPAGKPLGLYQGYQDYPQGYQPAAINSGPHSRSSATVTFHQDQQSARDSHSYGYPAPEMGQNSEGHRYSPEKTPYMDTVNDTDKTYNTVYNTHGTYESFPECDTNSQLAGSSVCDNDNSAHSRYQPRDIIAMSELEDFMELSDW